MNIDDFNDFAFFNSLAFLSRLDQISSLNRHQRHQAHRLTDLPESLRTPSDSWEGLRFGGPLSFSVRVSPEC
jgi:hypothetical protein